MTPLQAQRAADLDDLIARLRWAHPKTTLRRAHAFACVGRGFGELGEAGEGGAVMLMVKTAPRGDPTPITGVAYEALRGRRQRVLDQAVRSVVKDIPSGSVVLVEPPGEVPYTYLGPAIRQRFARLWAERDA